MSVFSCNTVCLHFTVIPIVPVYVYLSIEFYYYYSLTDSTEWHFYPKFSVVSHMTLKLMPAEKFEL